MADRHREKISTVVDRENLHVRPVKAALVKLPTRRPALDELSNKLNGIRNATEKHLEPLKKKEVLTKGNNPVKENEVEDKSVKSYSTRQLESIIDPDVDTQHQPQLVTEYVNDIYKYLREMEVKYSIREKFLEGHSTTPRMRAILVDWLVQVHTNFKLCLETLFLCISIVDRYLQEDSTVDRKILQLVGVSALMVACKYEEIYLPDLSDYVYICNKTFTSGQILSMEKDILKKLDFSLGRPLSIHFLRRYSKIAQVQLEHHTLSKYILELSLIDHNMSHIRPSIQAAAACCLSLSILNEVNCPSKVWTPTLIHYTTYKYSDLKDTVIKFANLLVNADNYSKNKTIQSKYAASTCSKISTNPKLKGTLVKRLAQTIHKSTHI